jgi:hypothetical protein
VGDRIKRAGIPYRRARENLARGESALLAHETIEESPAHLLNLLDPRTTHLGVGVARGRLSTGEPVTYLSEILVERVDDGSDSPLRPETRVKEELWRERQSLGKPALLADPTLDSLAARAARRMWQADALDLEGAVEEALALPRKLAAGEAFVGSSPGEAARSLHLEDARFRRVGVGVYVGDSPTRGAGLLWIAVIYSD